MVGAPDLQLLAAQEQVSAAWVQAWAAIVQGVLSVITIIVAFRIAATDRRHEATLRAAEAETAASRENVVLVRRARTAALGVLPALLQAFSDLSWADGQIKDGHLPHEIGNDGPDPEDRIRLWNMPALSPELKSLQPTLSELGSAAGPVQTAYFMLMHLQEEFDGYRRSMRYEGPEHEWQLNDKERARVAELLSDAVTRTEAAIDALGRLFRGMGTE